MASVVVVEEVTGGKPLARFTELPQALHGDDPRFAPLVTAWERYRLDARRNPYFERGDGRFFLARRMGRPVGRITAHVDEPGGAGRFGFWWIDDDPGVAAALVEAARGWLEAQGRSSMTGPWSFTRAEEAGLQVAGHEVSGVTGRPWHPPHLAARLEALGFTGVADHPTWRLPTTDGDPLRPEARERPGQAGAYVDPRLVLEGIAAVPDVAEALRTTGLRGAWQLARRAKERAWDVATVVRCDADPAVAVPALRAAAGRAGYRWLVSPWTPDASVEPEAVHREYRLEW